MNEISKNSTSCRKLFYNCDGVLSCIAPFADDITIEKCMYGKGECEFRINNLTGKPNPLGTRY